MNSPPQLPPRLIAQCLDHMDREQQALDDSLGALRRMRDALVRRRQEDVLAAVAQQQEVAGQAAEMTSAREQLRQELAPLLGLPSAEVNFSALAECLPEHAVEIRRRRQALLERAEEADLLNRMNVALIQQAIELLAGVLSCLAGEEVDQRYDQDGHMGAAVRGSLIQKQC